VFRVYVVFCLVVSTSAIDCLERLVLSCYVLSETLNLHTHGHVSLFTMVGHEENICDIWALKSSVLVRFECYLDVAIASKEAVSTPGGERGRN